jgi:hypothetical protein
MFSPCFSFTAGQNYTLKFWRELSSNMASTTLTVGLYATPSSSSLVGDLLYTENITHTWKEIEIVFSPEISGNYCIGFHAQSNSFTGIVAIDDLSLQAANPPRKIVALTPVPNSTDANINTEVSVLFDHPVVLQNPSLITITGATGVLASADTAIPNKLLITHHHFHFNTPYTVNIPAGAVADFTDTSWHFTTVDSTVELEGMYPAQDEKGVFPNQKVILSFNQNPIVLNLSLISFDHGISVTGASVEGNVLYIEHTPYSRGQNYTLTIAKGAIERYAGTTITFSTAADGELPDVTALYGPVNFIANLRGISENGRYCAGQSTYYGAFMWDVLLNGYYPLSANSYNSESYAVSNDGHTVLYTQATNNDLSVPMVWFEGEKTTLPYNQSGTALCITPDGTKIGGHTQGDTPMANMGSLGCVWTNDNNNYTRQDYATFPGYTSNQTRVEMLSTNGTIAVGRTNIHDLTQTTYEACYWNNPDSITLVNLSREYQTDMSCISGNGRWGGIFRGGGLSPAIYDFQINTITELPCGSGPINSITNDGLAISVEGNVSSGWNTYVYNIITKDCKPFAQWVNQDLTKTFVMNDEIMTALNTQVGLSGTKCRVMSVSSNGQNWAIQNDARAFVLHLKKKTDAIKEPAGKIITQVFPTITKDQIRVITQGKASVKVIDMLGRMIQNAIMENDLTLSLNHAKNGIYFVVIETPSGNATHKIVLNKF